MIQPGRWFVVVVIVFLAAGCGGSGPGSAPTGQAVKAPQCPVHAAPGNGSSYAGGCRSPDEVWRLRIRELSGSESKLFLARRGQSKSIPMYTSAGCCWTYIGWAKPHLLFFLESTLVMSLDPASRKVRHLAQLSDMAVSPDGRWLAGDGPGGPEEPIAQTVYVLSTDAHECLVVPGHPASVQGFTSDSKAVIVLRSYTYPDTKLIQYAISSLPTGCPTGPNGVLLNKG